MSLLDLFKQELTFEETVRKSGELANLIKETYSPNLVIAIAAGGVLPGNEISKNLNVNYTQLTIKRDIDLRDTYKSVPRILRPFIEIYQEYLFMTTTPTLIGDIDFLCKGMDILLVDDTVHTGKTLKIAVENLQKKGARQIKSATINYVDGIMPDYFIMKGRIKFPWSKNSLEYEKFRSYANAVLDYKTSSGLQHSTTLCPHYFSHQNL